MNRILLSMAFCGVFASPALMAQTAPPEGEHEETDQELAAKLVKFMKKASEEMGELEKELAKASQSAPKADVVNERLNKIREQMKQGKLDELPEGLRKEILENPDEVAKAAGKTANEVRKISEKEAELRELLQKNPELLKKLAENEETMQRVLEKQNDVEKRLAETLERTEEAANEANKNIDGAIGVAHMLKQQGSGGGGDGKPKNKGEKTGDARDKDGQQGGDGESKKGAEGQYQPGPGEKLDDKKTEEFERADGKGGFQGDKKGKDATDGSGNDDNRREPEKYKGFWEKFIREARKKAEDAKKETK